MNPPGEYIPPDRQWVIQWQCCQRWYWRVVEVQKKAHKQEIQQDDIDTVIAFFQNAYHLKDWVLTSRPGLKDAINALFRDSFEMGACRDICNGFKHKRLNSPSHDPDFNLYREYDHSEIEGINPVKYRITFTEDDDVRKFDLFELVSVVYQQWENFLSAKSKELAK